jgi:hypothetical protein
VVAAKAVMTFEVQEREREVQRQRRLLQHTARLMSHTLLRHFHAWKEFTLFSKTASSCLQTVVRRRALRPPMELRRNAAILVQAYCRQLRRAGLLVQMREEERVRVEAARKKRLLNNTPAAKAVTKISPRFIRGWQAVSEPFQHLPFHGPTPMTSSLLQAQRRAEQNEKELQEAEAALRRHAEENERLKLALSSQLETVKEQQWNAPLALHASDSDDKDSWEDTDSLSDGSESDQVLNAEIDTLEAKLQVECYLPSRPLSASLCRMLLGLPLSLSLSLSLSLTAPIPLACLKSSVPEQAR